jgi:Rap1a immunity proteins
MRRISFVAAALLVSGSAWSVSGNGLAKYCRGADRNPEWGYCVGYVMGVVDEVLSSSGTRPFCISPEAIESQVARVAARWFEKNPEKLHFSATSLVRAALAEAFPCKPR